MTQDTAVVVTKMLNSTVTVREIREHHTTVIQHMTEAALHACQAGDLLLQMKAQLKHGQWEPWVKRYCPFLSIRTAQEYMRLAAAVPKTQRAAVLKGKSLRQGLKLLRPPREPKAQQTLETLNTGTKPPRAVLEDDKTVEVGRRDPSIYDGLHVIIGYFNNGDLDKLLAPLEAVGHDCSEAHSAGKVFCDALVKLSEGTR
jgi:hypothetical protein